MSYPPNGQPAPPPGHGGPAGGGFGPPPPQGYGPPAPQGYPGPQGYQGHPAGPAYSPGYGQPPVPPRRTGRGAKIAAFAAAGVLGLGLLGGGAVFAYSKVNGSGPQPEEALPGNAVAFAKVDLDPSADQKIDAYRFLRKFPDAKDAVGNPADDADLRKVIFEGIQKEGGLEGLSYGSDVEPWLGDRFGVAMLAGGEGEQPTGVVALAVTDTDKAKAGLAKATGAEGGYCSVGDAFAICGQDQAVVDKAVNDAASGSLADSANFSDDMKALGEDGLMTAWVDGDAASKIAGAAMMGGGGSTGQSSGRVAMALRFDGPTLELAGTASGQQAGMLSDDDVSVDSLPSDATGVLSVRGLGPAVKTMWGDLEKQAKGVVGDDQWQSGLDEARTATGLSLPDDLAALLGDDTSVVMGGPAADGVPKIALRSNGEKAKADTLVSTLSGQSGSPLPLVTKDGSDGTYVLATEGGYASHVATGSGLGDSDAFTDAVPDADDANAVAYVDIEQVVAQYGQDMDDEAKRNLGGLKAFGMSASSDGDRSDFRVRLTTR